MQKYVFYWLKHAQKLWSQDFHDLVTIHITLLLAVVLEPVSQFQDILDWCEVLDISQVYCSVK